MEFRPNATVFCLIFSDETWDITPDQKVREAITQFWRHCNDRQWNKAITCMRELKPQCVRMKTIDELQGIILFKSFKGNIEERKHTEEFFSALQAVLKDRQVRQIRVYTMAKQRDRRLLFHNCELTLVIGDSNHPS